MFSKRNHTTWQHTSNIEHLERMLKTKNRFWKGEQNILLCYGCHLLAGQIDDVTIDDAKFPCDLHVIYIMLVVCFAKANSVCSRKAADSLCPFLKGIVTHRLTTQMSWCSKTESLQMFSLLCSSEESRTWLGDSLASKRTPKNIKVIHPTVPSK